MHTILDVFLWRGLLLLVMIAALLLGLALAKAATWISARIQRANERRTPVAVLRQLRA